MFTRRGVFGLLASFVAALGIGMAATGSVSAQNGPTAASVDFPKEASFVGKVVNVVQKNGDATVILQDNGTQKFFTIPKTDQAAIGAMFLDKGTTRTWTVTFNDQVGKGTEASPHKATSEERG